MRDQPWGQERFTLRINSASDGEEAPLCQVRSVEEEEWQVPTSECCQCSKSVLQRNHYDIRVYRRFQGAVLAQRYVWKACTPRVRDERCRGEMRGYIYIYIYIYISWRPQTHARCIWHLKSVLHPSRKQAHSSGGAWRRLHLYGCQRRFGLVQTGDGSSI